MVQNSRFSDSHLHIVEEGWRDRYSDLDSAGILMACTARPAEWDVQSGISDTNVIGSYGVHPWYADEWNDEIRGRLISILEGDGNRHVGEIGLDYKRGSVKDQMPVFEDQLRIASDMGRIATIHMMGTEKEVLESVRAHGKGCPGIILHSYGSDSYLKPFSELNCHFSISLMSSKPISIDNSSLILSLSGEKGNGLNPTFRTGGVTSTTRFSMTVSGRFPLKYPTVNSKR